MMQSSTDFHQKLSQMNTKELKEYCRLNKIRGYSGLQKHQIQDLILGKFVQATKTYKYDETELDSLVQLQKKKLPELKFISKKLHLNVHKHTKIKIIQAILHRNEKCQHKQQQSQQQQQHLDDNNANFKMNDNHNNNSTTTTPKLLSIEAKFYTLSENDESPLSSPSFSSSSSSSSFNQFNQS